MKIARGKLLFDMIQLEHETNNNGIDVDFSIWIYPNGDITYSVTAMLLIPKYHLLWLK